MISIHNILIISFNPCVSRLLSSVNVCVCVCVCVVDWVPVLRDLVSVGVKLFAICVSCSLSLLTISIGWLLYRPLVAALIAAVALLPVFITHARKVEKKHQ